MSFQVRKAGYDTKVGFDKIERYKGEVGTLQILRVMPVQIEGVSGVFFESAFYSGNRADNSRFVVNASPDPAQNYCESVMGLKQQRSIVCVVLIAASRRAIPVNSPWQIEAKCKVWSMGPDKWNRLLAIAASQNLPDPEQLQSIGLQVTCTEPTFQRLNIDPVGDPLSSLTGNPEVKKSITDSYAEAVEDLKTMLKPGTYQEQAQAVAGRTTTPGTFAGPGAGPAFGALPPAAGPAFGAPPTTFAGPGAGPAFGALPPAAGPAFGAPPTTFAPPPAAPPVSFAPPPTAPPTAPSTTFAPPAAGPAFGGGSPAPVQQEPPAPPSAATIESILASVAPPAQS